MTEVLKDKRLSLLWSAVALIDRALDMEPNGDWRIVLTDTRRDIVGRIDALRSEESGK